MTRSGSQRSHASRVPRPLAIPTSMSPEIQTSEAMRGNSGKQEEAGVTSQLGGERISYPVMSVQNHSPTHVRAQQDSALHDVDEVPRSPTDSNERLYVGLPSPASTGVVAGNARRMAGRMRDEDRNVPPPSYEATVSHDVTSSGHGELEV